MAYSKKLAALPVPCSASLRCRSGMTGGASASGTGMAVRYGHLLDISLICSTGDSMNRRPYLSALAEIFDLRSSSRLAVTPSQLSSKWNLTSAQSYAVKTVTHALRAL